MGDGKNLLELKGVTKDFAATPDALPLRILNGVDFCLKAGECVAIVGPSGSGKSTLLNIIGALDTPTAGQVLLDGRDLAAMKDRQLAEIRNQEIGFIFQAHHLLPQCSVIENVLVPTLVQPHGAKKAAAQERAHALLDRVGLGERLTHRPGQLSGGECQRVAVVRALINQPKLLLADEPTGSLDGPTAEALGDLLVELNREMHLTLMVVTHAMGLARRMNRVLALAHGKLREHEGGAP